MKRLLLVLICCSVVVASGVIHGHWTGRWESSQALEEALARVPDVPMTFGNWHGEGLEVDPAPYAQAGAQSYWMRRYQHAKTGEAVSVILMCGRGGRLAVHTPDVCYQGAGYQLVGQPKKTTITVKDSASAEFWTGSFVKDNNPAVGRLQVYWTWGSDNHWQAPDVPRFTFRGQPFLYKLYVIRQCTAENEVADGGPTLDFLRELVPQLDTTLFSGSPP